MTVRERRVPWRSGRGWSRNANPPGEPSSVTANDSKPRVMLIDDAVDVHRLMNARLRHENFRLICFTNGADAVEAAKADPPATILLDLDMPEIDGFEVLRRLKEDSSTHNIPVIVLSGHSESDDKVAAFDLGATDFVTKPCDLAELRARLRAALRMHHLLRLLSEQADVDGLTGLGNRAAFDKRWVEHVAECERYGRPLSLVIMDIDHFKKINDTFGHPAGDEVIAGFANLILEHCRASDIACRYGGEEFALILPETTPADAAVMAERIRVALSETAWTRHPEHRTTTSMGVAGSDGGTKIAASVWLEIADRNLYSAKRGGRNRIVSSNLGPSDSGNKSKPGLAKAG